MENLSFRNAELDLRGLDEKARTVPAILSTDEPVTVSRGLGPVQEVLRHDSNSIDLSRAKTGLPLLFNHNRDKPIGIVENIRIESNKLVGMLRFSRNSQAKEIFRDVIDRTLRGISVGYSVQEQEHDGDTVIATRWKVFEASVTPVQADDGAQILRNKTMGDKDKGGDGNVTQLPAVQDALKAEQIRRREVDQLFITFQDHRGVAVIRDECKDNMQCTVEQARQKLLIFLGSQSSPAGGDAYRSGEYPGNVHITMDDGGDEFRAAASDALCIRSNIPISKPHPGAKDLTAVSIVEMARMYLAHRGVSASGMAKGELINRAMTTSDFPLLLADAASKSVIGGYNEAPGTHRGISRLTFAPDFKKTFRVAAGEAPDLELVNEDGEFKYSALTETGTSVSLATYGGLQAVSRQTLINDDTGEILRALRGRGAAATRLEADVTWGVLISNPVMSDGQTLFHATHNNIATAAVPTVTSLGEMRELLRKQKGLGGDAFLDIQPFAVLAPAALETVLEQLLSSLFDPFPATGTSDSAARNPFANRLDLIIDPRLDDDSATRWYLITNPEVFNWFDRVHLEGQPAPFVAEQTGWSIDGTEIKVRHDFAALITEYRGIVKNDGV